MDGSSSCLKFQFSFFSFVNMAQIRHFVFLCALFCVLTSNSYAALIELSATGGLNKTEYSDGYKGEQRRYTGSLDFKFTQVSSIQFEYTDNTQTASYNINICTTIITCYIKTNVKDKSKVYSFNWVQNLVPSKWLIQPYFLVGGGKMVRSYTQTYAGKADWDYTYNQTVTTGTGGVGLRIFLTRSLAIKGEFKTYVPNFKFNQWKENQLMSVGISWVL